jgi:hypothetical protein
MHQILIRIEAPPIEMRDSNNQLQHDLIPNLISRERGSNYHFTRKPTLELFQPTASPLISASKFEIGEEQPCIVAMIVVGLIADNVETGLNCPQLTSTEGLTVPDQPWSLDSPNTRPHAAEKFAPGVNRFCSTNKRTGGTAREYQQVTPLHRNHEAVDDDMRISLLPARD